MNDNSRHLPARKQVIRKDKRSYTVADERGNRTYWFHETNEWPAGDTVHLDYGATWEPVAELYPKAENPERTRDVRGVEVIVWHVEWIATVFATALDPRETVQEYLDSTEVALLPLAFPYRPSVEQLRALYDRLLGPYHPMHQEYNVVSISALVTAQPGRGPVGRFTRQVRGFR